MKNIDQVFEQLAKSKFRSRFCLKGKELDYFNQKGIIEIMLHAQDFLKNRLAPVQPINDGKQTPMRNHPVFIAQHATALCCRKCMSKWHNIPMGIELSHEQLQYCLDIIERWLVNSTSK